jgi:large repetitive protein
MTGREPGLRRTLRAAALAAAAVLMMVPTSPAQATQASSAHASVLALVAPTFTGFSPRGGPMYTKVIIVGTGFKGTTHVLFHGVDAQFTVVSSTRIRAFVPCGTTTGHISVHTPRGIARSAGLFRIP